MAERLGLVPGREYELKIGQSFNKKPGNDSSAFHTIRYDFKPASVDPTKMGTLEVQDKTVTVNVPNLDGNQQTNYSGHMMDSNKKECVLIIDQETGEISLERISNQVRVKKTRQERQEKQEDQLLMESMSSRIGCSSRTMSSVAKASPSSSSSSSSAMSRPITPLDSSFRRGSPASNVPSPITQSGTASPHNPGTSGASMPTFGAGQGSNDGFSEVNINDMLSGMSSMSGTSSNVSNGRGSPMTFNENSRAASAGKVKPKPRPPAPPQSQGARPATELSDDSSSSSDSNSDSDSDSDSDSEPASTPFTNQPKTQQPSPMSMPSFGGSLDLPTPPPTSSAAASKPISNPGASGQRPPPANNLSMPQFLNDDLQLSDDDSDSDGL